MGGSGIAKFAGELLLAFSGVVLTSEGHVLAGMGLFLAALCFGIAGEIDVLKERKKTQRNVL